MIGHDSQKVPTFDYKVDKTYKKVNNKVRDYETVPVFVFGNVKSTVSISVENRNNQETSCKKDNRVRKEDEPK